MKKIIAMGMFLVSVASYASWWGHLDGGVRAAIIGTSAIILNENYQSSEMKHQRDLDKLDTQVRRNYEKEAVLENAHRKYSNVGVPARLEGNYTKSTKPTKVKREVQGKARVVYSDERTQIIELADGTRITLNQ